MSDFDPDCDLVVGHNIISFDLPFIFQRCLANNIPVKPFIDLGEFHVRGVYDTMRGWWLGDRRSRVGLDDLAWTLGFESSKTGEVEGSQSVRTLPGRQTRRDSRIQFERRARDAKSLRAHGRVFRRMNYADYTDS